MLKSDTMSYLELQQLLDVFLGRLALSIGILPGLISPLIVRGAENIYIMRQGVIVHCQYIFILRSFRLYDN